MTISHEYPLLDTLSPQQVSAFLSRKGWVVQEHPNPDLLVFSNPNDDDISLVLPAQQTFADYPAKLRDCVETLSYLYKINIQVLVHHMARWDRDVLTVRRKMTKQYTVKIGSCSECPKESSAHGNEHICFAKRGRKITTFGIPSWCPLDDAKEED